MTNPTFQLTLSADFYTADGQLRFADIGLDVLHRHPHIQTARMQTQHNPIEAQQLRDANAAVILAPRVTAQTIQDSEQLLAIGRFGVGFDSVDVTACTDSDVLVMTTPGAVDRSMAEATVGWMIALTHNMRIKDRLVRTGDWDQRTQHNGCELRDRTLGIVGLGGIGRHVITLLQGFGMQPPVACDPFVPSSVAEHMGVRLLSLSELMATADFVSVHCPLNDSTRGLIGESELALMKPDAWLINTARGGIVDEDALHDCLHQRRIAGAALDCFQDEPVTSPSRFAGLDNVLLAPHSIAWTDEFFRDIGRSAFGSMVDLSLGRRPHGMLNPELLDRDSFRHKWQRITGHPPADSVSP